MNFVGDSMIINAIRFRNINIGNLPQLSYIFLHPEPLGIGLNTLECYVNYALLFVEIQRGKEGMKKSNYHIYIGTAAAFMNSMMEAKKCLVQKELKGDTKDCFLFCSLFASKSLDGDVMDVVADIFDMI